MSISTATGATGPARINYGWVVVFASFAMFTVDFAIQYSFGIFLKPLEETFGWSRATTSWAMTIHLMTFALCMIPAGWAIDRVNTRILYSITAVCVGGLLFLSSRIEEPWQLYLLYGLLGIGLCICGPIILTIVTRWFTKNRGVALGISSAGFGFGTLVGAPLTYSLITAYGWRDTFVIMGIAAAVILLVCAYFVKSPPGYGRLAAKSLDQTNKPVLTGMTFRQALGSRQMLFLAPTLGFFNFAKTAVMIHIAPHAIDIGISPWVAAAALGTIGGASIMGRLVMGFVQDRIGPMRSMMICLTVQGVSMFALPFIRLDVLFFIYAVIFGFTYGGDVPQVPAIVAQCFGLASMGTIFGMTAGLGNILGALGPIAAGYVFDLTASYVIAFLVVGLGLFTGAFCLTRLIKIQARAS
ncbi:MAG: MFS transporter [Dehalococcoidales bacterium]|nr:MFS transporter [Dehalococcoidales bacterium]